MTKADLIHFLEPFMDEINIVIRSPNGLMLVDFKPKYEVRKHPFRTTNGILLESGEGVVILGEYE